MLTKMIMDYKRDMSSSALPAEKSLSTSELRDMIKDAVDSATAQLTERIEHLEENATGSPRALTSGSEEHEAVELPQGDASRETTARRKAR